MNAPQIIWIVLAAMTLTVDLMKDGQPKTGKHSFTTSLIGVGVAGTLLWWGGFFGGAA